MVKIQSHEVKKVKEVLEPASMPTKATIIDNTNSRPPNGDASQLLSFNAKDFTQGVLP
jgi:hypothetical protein